MSENEVKAPRTRFYRHLPEVGVSFGMEWVKDKQTVVVTAAVAGKDQWCRKAASEIIDLRFDASDATLKALGIKRFLVDFPYSGDKPCRDVLNKLPVGRTTRNGPADEVFFALDSMDALACLGIVELVEVVPAVG